MASIKLRGVWYFSQSLSTANLSCRARLQHKNERQMSYFRICLQPCELNSFYYQSHISSKERFELKLKPSPEAVVFCSSHLPELSPVASSILQPVLCISVCLLEFCPTRGDLFTSNLVLSRSQTTILRTRLGCTVGSGVAGLRCCTEVYCDFLPSERFQEPPEVRKSIYLSNSPVS